MKKILILMLLFLAMALSLQDVQAESERDAFKELVGRWVRPDGGYILEIKSVNEDGSMDASYLNPRSINVSKAKASIEDGQVKIFLELRDKMYPGSYYTLAYDPDSNRLVGVYHHLGINRNFDVFFVRE